MQPTQARARQEVGCGPGALTTITASKLMPNPQFTDEETEAQSHTVRWLSWTGMPVASKRLGPPLLAQEEPAEMQRLGFCGAQCRLAMPKSLV